MNSSSVDRDRLQTVSSVESIHAPKRATNLQRWFVAALLAFFVLLSIQYSYKAVAGRSAFVRWRSQIEHLDDADIYQRFNYPNPPIMAVGMARAHATPRGVAGMVLFESGHGARVLLLGVPPCRGVRSEERRKKMEDRRSRVED
jgi:hypothetical protein